MVLLAVWWVSCESSTDRVRRAYSEVVTFCVAGDTEALWSVSSDNFKQNVDLYAVGLQALGAKDLEQMFAYQGNPRAFLGKDYLKGVVAKGDNVDNPCSHARDWTVVETGVVGEKYVVGLSRPDGRIFGMKLVNENGRWMLDEITKSRADPRIIASADNTALAKSPPVKPAADAPAPAEDRAAVNRDAWLTGTFRCRAISTVKFRKCRFKKADSGYSLKFQNDIRCKDVEFDEKGHPAKLLGCRSNWLKIPRNNKLKKLKRQNIWVGSRSGWSWENGEKYCCPGIWLEAPAELTESM